MSAFENVISFLLDTKCGFPAKRIGQQCCRGHLPLLWDVFFSHYSALRANDAQISRQADRQLPELMCPDVSKTVLTEEASFVAVIM